MTVETTEQRRIRITRETAERFHRVWHRSDAKRPCHLCSNIAKSEAGFNMIVAGMDKAF